MTEKYGTVVYAPVVAGGNTDDDLASAYGDELGRTIHHFDTEQQKTDFTAKYKSRLFDSWCVVKESSAWYEWTGTKQDGSDGDWQEIDMGGASGPTLTLNEQWGDYTQITGVNEINFLPPLEVQQSLSGPNNPTPGAANVIIKPGIYEPMHAPSFLGKATDIRPIKENVDTVIDCSDTITPYGMYFSHNAVLGGLNIQEDDGADPNAGGQLTELLCSVDFDITAPSAGTIKLWLMYHQNGAYIPNGFLTDVNGNPFIVEKTVNAGENLRLVLDGAYYAKGLETVTMHFEHSFTGEILTIKPDTTLMCVNQFQSGSESSMARIQFQRRLGLSIIPSVFKFDDNFISMSEFLTGLNKPETELDAGQGEEFINQFGLNNLSKVKASIQNGIISIGDNGTDIADFYFDYLVDNSRTAMMRGKEFDADFGIANVDNSFIAAVYVWTGEADKPSKLYSSRNNGSLVLNSGWSKVNEVFFSEQIDGSTHAQTLTSTIPNTANNIAWLIYPVEAQMPNNLTISQFDVSPASGFTGYTEIEKTNLREQHLSTSDTYLELGQNNHGFYSLRYTLNYKPLDGNPLPVGEVMKGKAPLVLDPALNVVVGSQAGHGEGALKATKDGQASVSCEYGFRNEQNTGTVVDVWWVLIADDKTESKIAGSEQQYTIPANTSHSIVKTQPAFIVEMETGQAIAPRASANKNDGAYMQSESKTDYIIRPIIDFKELVTPGNSDDPELVSAPLQKALVEDKRVYSFTGNTLQNLVIDLDIPSDVELAEIEVVKHSGTKTTSIKDCEYSYDSSTKKLTVHVGSAVADGKIYLTFWSAIS